ncbi:MAG TPA: outer membrane beta-barrel protein [Cyclobacteriaceae bacterium]|nr:outer membrane beta-barrel protein [Cyclobacteriaceae bacterium]
MRRPLIVLTVLITLCSARTTALAQGDTDCLATLSQAESEFAAGRFIGIPELLSACLDNNRFSNEEQVRVNMLLAQVYLLTDNPAAADDSYLRLLRANPEFIPSDADPIDIVYLSKKFTSTPIFTPHFKAGGNYSTQSVIYLQNAISTPDSTSLRREGQLGWTIGGGVEWNINDNLGIGGEIFLSQKRFTTRFARMFKHDDGRVTESQLWLDVPLYLRYGFNPTGRVRPFMYAGGAVNLLLNTRVEQEFNDRTEGTGSEAEKVAPTSGAATSINYKRNFLNRSLVFGGGAKFKMGKDFVVVDVRYMPGLSNVTNMKYNNYSSKAQDEIDPSSWQYTTIGDMFRVNNFSISLGYVRPLYNPRKANRVKTKSVSRKLIRDEKDEK